jgi:hypothetical protein
MKNLFCEDNCHSKFCLRRIAGSIGFAAFIVAIFTGINDSSLDLLGMLSASLIGLTTVDKFRPKTQS